MNVIHRDIYVTRNQSVQPIDIVRSSQVSIELQLMDYEIPAGATVKAYAREKSASSANETICTASEKTVSFTPPDGFFAPGLNRLQIEIDGEIMPFAVDVNCGIRISDAGPPATPQQVIPLVERAEAAATDAEAAKEAVKALQTELEKNYPEVPVLKDDLSKLTAATADVSEHVEEQLAEPEFEYKEDGCRFNLTPDMSAINEEKHEVTTYTTAKYLVTPGVTYRIKFSQGEVNRYMVGNVFTDAEKNVLSYYARDDGATNVKSFTVDVVAPDGAAYLYLSGTLAKGVSAYSLDTYCVREYRQKSPFAREYNPTPIITFIDDDGNASAEQNFVDVLKSNGMVGCIGIITDRVGDANMLSLEDLQRLKNDGIEPLSHSASHGDFYLQENILGNIDALTDDLRRSHIFMAQNGFTDNCIVYPHGGQRMDNQIMRFFRNEARKFYDYGIDISGGVMTETPLHSLGLCRFFAKGIGEDNNFDDVKAKIDECVTKEGWLIIGTHSGYQIDLGNFSGVVAYVKALVDSGSVRVLNFTDAISERKNICSIGDYYQGEKLYVGADGKIVV